MRAPRHATRRRATPVAAACAAAARSAARSIAALSGALLAACSGSSTDASEPGELRGTVTIVGEPAPGVELLHGEVVVSLDPDAPRSAAVRVAPLGAGPRTFTFAAAGLPAGRYFVEACFTYPAGRGCRPYSTATNGDPTAVEVRPGRATAIALDF